MKYLFRLLLATAFLGLGPGLTQENGSSGDGISAVDTMRLRQEKMRLGSESSGQRFSSDSEILSSVTPLYIDDDPVFQDWVANVAPVQNIVLDYSDRDQDVLPGELIRSIGGNSPRAGKLTQVTALLLNNNRPICSATAITRKHFLTAAHCFCGLSKPVTIAFGRNTQKASLLRKFGTKFRLIDDAADMDCTDYRSMRRTIAGSDLAVVELNQEIGELYLKFPIEMATSDEIASLKKGTVTLIAGFGRRSHNPNSRLYRIGVKNYLKSPIVDVTCIGSRYNCVQGREVISRDTRQGGLGPCSGDSGGPMFFKTDRGSGPKWVLVGVVSRMARADLRCGDAVAFSLLSSENLSQVKQLLND